MGRFVVEETDAALDGGSIFLRTRDAEGHPHRVELVQSMFLESQDSARLPGRLYVDGELVAIRSEQERALLEGLREAISAPGGMPNGGEFVRELLRCVESERYVALAKRGNEQKR